MRKLDLIVACAAVSIAAPAVAETPRELLVSAAFVVRDKPTALAKINTALKASAAALVRNPADREARLQHAVALGYRGKLKRSRGDIQAARQAFEALVASNPHDPEAQTALGGWHLGAIIELGPLVARTALGARRARGLQALDSAVKGSGGRAFFPAFASMNRIQLDPGDVAGARRLAEAAVKARATTAIDGIMQRRAATLLTSLRAGNGAAAAKLAGELLPFGRLPG